MPDIYQTDNLDEAIDIVQDLTKVNRKKHEQMMSIFSSAISIHSSQI